MVIRSGWCPISNPDCEVYRIVETQFDGKEAKAVSFYVDYLKERSIDWTLRFPEEWRTITVLDLIMYRSEVEREREVRV